MIIEESKCRLLNKGEEPEESVSIPLIMHSHPFLHQIRHLHIKLRAAPTQQPLHLLIDSSGFKVYGEGEWYVRLRKQFRRRTWRKLHIAVDHRSGLVVGAVGSHKDLLDRDALGELLDQTEQAVKAVYADGAYDYKICYKAIYERGSEAIIPPKRRGVLHKQEWMASRNQNILQMRKHGLEKWKHKSGYHKRSLVETAFYRLKTIFSDRLRSRREDTQSTEAMIICMALNRMTQLGMPDSYRV